MGSSQIYFTTLETYTKFFFTNKLVFKLFIHLVLVNINGQRGNCTCSYIDDIVIYLKIFKQTLYMFVKIFGDRIIYTSFQNKVCVLFSLEE